MGATSPGQGSDLGAFCRKLTSPKSIFSHHNSRASCEERQKPCPQPSKLRFRSLSLDFLPPLGPQQNLPLLAFPPWSKRIRATTSGAGARSGVRRRRYTLTTMQRLSQGQGHEGQSRAGHTYEMMGRSATTVRSTSLTYLKCKGFKGKALLYKTSYSSPNKRKLLGEKTTK